MKGVRGGAAALVLLIGGLLAANLFGRQLNQFFLAFPGIDKILHLGFHALLYPCLRAVAAVAVRRPSAQSALAFGAGLVVALADEIVQGFSPGRSVEVADIVADVAGLGLGWIATVRPAARIAAPVAAAAVLAAGLVTWHTHVRLRDYARGLRAEQARDFVAAHEHFLAAYRNGLHSADLFNGLAWSLVESGKGDPAEAVAWGRRAYDLRPDDPDILDTYGWTLVRAGRAGEAAPLLEQVYARRPDMYCIHYHLGMAYRALGREADAAAHFRQQAGLTGTHEAVLATRALAELRGR
jgi:tetratricopeptide (TPR) repeat protein